jgi:hypothetical protein
MILVIWQSGLGSAFPLAALLHSVVADSGCPVSRVVCRTTRRGQSARYISRVAAGSPVYRELGRRAHYSSTTLWDAAAPYVGLAMFQTEDAGRYSGRERLVTELVDQIARQRFLILVGPSGSWKNARPTSPP